MSERRGSIGIPARGGGASAPLRSMRGAFVVMAVLAAAPAAAQSHRYPPAPVDRDDADRSRVWMQALDPDRAPYDELVARARKQLGDHPTIDQAKTAIDAAAHAIALQPDRSDAYLVRGEAELAIAAWVGCADDLAAAVARMTSRSSDAPAELAWTTARARELGICQARAGRYAEAERTLAATTAGSAQGELLMRLGEVRIAMGKLDEAIDALRAAAEQAERSSQAMIDWLLALAYDRARRPEDADDAARRAATVDRVYSLIENPQLPLLGVGEKEYLLGLAYRSDRGATGAFQSAEWALVYFRRFLAATPADNPWRRRAEEHVRELAALELPQAVVRLTGSAPLDLDAARAAVRRGMPQLRACVAKLPATVVEVIATRSGPRSPTSALDRPRYVVPPSGNVIRESKSLVEVDQHALDAATKCLEPIVARLAFPAAKDRDAYYMARFYVVAP